MFSLVFATLVSVVVCILIRPVLFYEEYKAKPIEMSCAVAKIFLKLNKCIHFTLIDHTIISLKRPIAVFVA